MRSAFGGSIPSFLMNLIDSGKLHAEDFKEGHYIDDTDGTMLDKKLVAEARKLEMKTFKEMGVYEYVSKEKAERDQQGKIVGVRWVDVMESSGVRSRLVAQEFASSED